MFDINNDIKKSIFIFCNDPEKSLLEIFELFVNFDYLVDG